MTRVKDHQVDLTDGLPIRGVHTSLIHTDTRFISLSRIKSATYQCISIKSPLLFLKCLRRTVKASANMVRPLLFRRLASRRTSLAFVPTSFRDKLTVSCDHNRRRGQGYSILMRHQLRR